MKLFVDVTHKETPPSPPSRGAWIEISCTMAVEVVTPSPPSRGAWIEISVSHPARGRTGVAPLAGGVD